MDRVFFGFRIVPLIQKLNRALSLRRACRVLGSGFGMPVADGLARGGQTRVTIHFTGAILLGFLLLPPSAADAVTTLVSVDSTGNPSNSGSGSPSISADGRFVAFESYASNLVVGDTNNATDIFVHDRQTGTTTRVSVDSAGNQSNGWSSSPSISADGRFVAFESSSRNLVAGDTNNADDIFVHDRQTGTTTRVSVDSAGNQSNGGSLFPSVSADGRFVAFQSYASYLVAGDTNDHPDIFVHDRQTGITTRVSVDSAGNQSDGWSYPPVISADGRFVAFNSLASNLVAGDSNIFSQVFVHDRQTGFTTRVSEDSVGDPSNGWSSSPAISADGRFVAFSSEASNLVARDTNNFGDIFVHDRQTATTTRVSVDSPGNQSNGSSVGPSISADGRFVAFQSYASNLVAGDTNNADDFNPYDIFVHDRQSATTTRVSVDDAGNQSNAGSETPVISADGRFVAFDSRASNLVARDSNNATDIFVYSMPCSTDVDCDGISDAQDNCLYVPNGPDSPDAGGASQWDTDSDGFGNLCDGDFNNDGFVNATDYAIFRSRLNTADADADLNGDGQVSPADYVILKTLFNRAPGPSGLVP